MKTWRLAAIAAVGALLVDIVLILSEGVERSFTVQRIPSHLTAIAVGGLIGWMYELLRELSVATTASLREISSLTSKIKYQDEALSMLTQCPRHNEVLTNLIATSMSDNFQNVPYVGEGAYLGFLAKAVAHSDGFQGIHRKPLGWFHSNSADSYLKSLRDHRMKYKVRIFVIDDADVPQMEDDLKDPETLKYYWENGGDVESYWVSTKLFKEYCPKLRVPDDFGLYDAPPRGTGQYGLLIAYDPSHQVLIFNLLDEKSDECRIFAAQQELSRSGINAFQPIPKG